MGNMRYVPASPQNHRVSFARKCSIRQDYGCNLTWDETALVVAAPLMFGGCEMRLGGGSDADNILDRGTGAQPVYCIEKTLRTWIIRKMSTNFICGIKNIRTDRAFD